MAAYDGPRWQVPVPLAIIPTHCNPGAHPRCLTGPLRAPPNRIVPQDDEPDDLTLPKTAGWSTPAGRRSPNVYFEGELHRRSAAHLLTRDEARRIAANIAKLRSCCGKSASANDDDQNSGISPSARAQAPLSTRGGVPLLLTTGLGSP